MRVDEDRELVEVHISDHMGYGDTPGNLISDVIGMLKGKAPDPRAELNSQPFILPFPQGIKKSFSYIVKQRTFPIFRNEN